MTSIILEYSYWWLIILVIVAFLYSYFLYRKDDSFTDVKKYVLILLKTLRFTLVFLLLFFLLKPLLKTTNKTVEKPIIAFLQDNSSSIILNKDSIFYKGEYKKQISKFITDLGNDYDFSFYSFGKNIEKTDSFGFSDAETNINKAIESVNKLYANRNIGAVIISSDGIYNEGSNPLYSDYSLDAPIYTIALGDSTIKKDIAISDIITNDIVYKANTFPVKVFVSSKSLQNKTANINIFSSGKLIANKKVKIKTSDANLELNFRIDAKEKGVKRYTVVIDSIWGEVNIENNKKDFIVEVVESKKQVLILANSPHPDISAIRKTLESSLLYKADYKLIEENIDNLEDYDLVIFHQLPSKSHDISSIITKLDNINMPLLFILGAQSNIKKFNKLNTGLKINTRINSYEETTALFNDKFTDFIVSDDFIDFTKDLPPLISSFGDYKLNKKASVFLYQKIKNIETQKPLIVFTQSEGKKYGIITGEGIWKWRISDFYNNNTFEFFDGFIEKTVQFMSVNIKNEPFIVTNKNKYNTDEDISIIAKLYNVSYELVNAHEVTLEIKNSEGDVFNYTFDKYYEYYRLKLGRLPVGDYSFVARTSISDDKYEKKSMFSVVKSNKESLNTIANFDLLNQLSEKFGGKTYTVTNLQKLKNQIKANKDISSVAYYQSYLSDLINNIWIFIILIILVSSEWAIRKFLGTY